MKCQFCGHNRDYVVDSRAEKRGEFIRRRRECMKCRRRFTTYEYIEDVLPHVVKRDGRREPFDRMKLRASIQKTSGKRSPAYAAAGDITTEIEGQLAEGERKYVTSIELGELVMSRLRPLDLMTYIRYCLGRGEAKDASDMYGWLKAIEREEETKRQPAVTRRARP